MTQHAVSHIRPAPQRRSDVRDKSSWRVALALVVLSSWSSAAPDCHEHGMHAPRG
jgi:hypothetical protein